MGTHVVWLTLALQWDFLPLLLSGRRAVDVLENVLESCSCGPGSSSVICFLAVCCLFRPQWKGSGVPSSEGGRGMASVMPSELVEGVCVDRQWSLLAEVWGWGKGPVARSVMQLWRDGAGSGVVSD